MSESSRTSDCLCGEVRISISGEPAAMAYCHCESCRRWLSAPIHAATLWPTANVRVEKGADRIGEYKRTDSSHRKFCQSCGAGVFVVHPKIGLTDVPAGSVHGLDFRPAMHVNYAEKVLSVPDGLPKYKDFPADFGGSGDTLPD